MSTNFLNILNNFNNIADNPENFISTHPNHSNKIKLFVKDIYDFTKNEEEKSIKNALPELIIDDFDLEQIFQEVELQNEEFLDQSLKNVSKFSFNKNSLLFSEVEKDIPPDEEIEEDENSSNSEDSEVEEDDESEEEQGDLNLEDDDDESIDSADDNKNNDGNHDVTQPKTKKKSIVDDEFFKLDEMEQFLKTEDKAFDKEPKDGSGNASDSNEDEHEIDYFESGSDIEDGDEGDLREKNPRYKDFFRPDEETASKKFNKFDREENEEELEDDNDIFDTAEQLEGPKSTFELREERLKNKIKILEDKALSDKPWQLLGEITAENRPQNSLLQEIVEFDSATRPAPVITEKTTLQLEDIILQRIKDNVFDSVQRKERPADTPLEYKKKLVLNQEKSKASLAQIYENEYLQQQEAVTGNSEEKDEEEPELHKEIKKMMTKLFGQLDALSNFHFTPKAAAPELKIISNLPAINMEEVAPVSTSDATLLAPEEVKGRIKGDLIGKSERTDADKNRERRKKKTKQKIHANEKKKKENLVNKINPGLGNKYSKEKMKKELEKITKERNVDKMDESFGSKSIKSSTAFFQQLENEVKSQIKMKSNPKKQKLDKGHNAKKLKL